MPGIGGTYWTTYFPAVLLLGFGGAFFIAPLTTTVFDAVPTEKSGIASGVNNAVARCAGLLAVAVFGILLTAVFDRGFDARLGRHHVGPRTAQIARVERAKLYAGSVPGDVPAEDREAVGDAVREGYLAGFRSVMLVSAGVCVLAALIALVELRGR
jgi:hypothetical protein